MSRDFKNFFIQLQENSVNYFCLLIKILLRIRLGNVESIRRKVGSNVRNFKLKVEMFGKLQLHPDTLNHISSMSSIEIIVKTLICGNFHNVRVMLNGT